MTVISGTLHARDDFTLPSHVAGWADYPFGLCSSVRFWIRRTFHCYPSRCSSAPQVESLQHYFGRRTTCVQTVVEGNDSFIVDDQFGSSVVVFDTSMMGLPGLTTLWAINNSDEDGQVNESLWKSPERFPTSRLMVTFTLGPDVTWCISLAE